MTTLCYCLEVGCYIQSLLYTIIYIYISSCGFPILCPYQILHKHKDEGVCRIRRMSSSVGETAWIRRTGDLDHDDTRNSSQLHDFRPSFTVWNTSADPLPATPGHKEVGAIPLAGVDIILLGRTTSRCLDHGGLFFP